MTDEPRGSNGHGSRRDINSLHEKVDRLNSHLTKWMLEQERRTSRLEVGYLVGAAIGVAMFAAILSQWLGA